MTDAVRFLVGSWTGEGTLHGDPFTTRMDVRVLLDHFVEVDYESTKDGQVVHRERVIYHAGSPTGLRAASYAANGTVMRWVVRESGEGSRLELRRDPRDGLQEVEHLWVIERRGEAVCRETFAAGERVLVDVTHRRTGDSPA